MASIQEKDGRYYVVWYDVAARRNRWESLSRLAKRPVTNERVAQQWFRVWLRDHKEVPAVNLSEFLARYREYSKRHKRPSTIKADNKRLKVFEQWAGMRGLTTLGEVTRSHIEEFRATLVCGPTGKKHYIGILRSVFNMAVRWELLPKSPTVGVADEPNYNPRPTRALSDAEVELILTEFAPGDRVFCALALYLGLRLSDIVYLQWDDIDFAKNAVRIAPKPSLGYAPKSTRHRSEIDVLPLHSRLKAILKDAHHYGAFVVPRIAANSWTNRIKREFRLHGIEGNIHSMRHTFVTRLASAGVHPFVLKHLARHADLRTTMRYTHLSDDDLRRGIEALSPYPVPEQAPPSRDKVTQGSNGFSNATKTKMS